MFVSSVLVYVLFVWVDYVCFECSCICSVRLSRLCLLRIVLYMFCSLEYIMFVSSVLVCGLFVWVDSVCFECSCICSVRLSRLCVFRVFVIVYVQFVLIYISAAIMLLWLVFITGKSHDNNQYVYRLPISELLYKIHSYVA